MGNIKLSVITPVFNAVQFIEPCILNVLSQKNSNIEHIIIDGGSNDGTVEIIERFAKKHKHIRWISEKDNGQSDAMNKGIRIAKSEYISFLNVDDYYEKGAISDILTIISQKNAPNFIVGNCNVWDENQKLIYVNRPQKLKPWHILSGQSLPVNPSAYFYKKNIHEKAGFYTVENYYNMDIEFIINASVKTNMKYYDKIWGNFLMLPNSKTGSDAKAGNMMDRKNRLLQSMLSKQSLYIKVRTKLYLYYTHYLKTIKKLFK